MFTLKVTYRGQTRKAVLNDLNSFPSYFELCSEVHRLFHIPSDIVLTRLFFTQDAFLTSHPLFPGQEVRCPSDYARCISQFQDTKSPNGVLKFVVVDTDDPPVFFDSTTADETSRGFSGRPLFPTPPIHPMDVDKTGTAGVPGQHPEIPLHHRSSMTSVSSCCSVSQSKADIKAMLCDFQAGLNNVIASDLQEPLVVHNRNSRQNSRNSMDVDNHAKIPPTCCSHCISDISSSEHGPQVWSSCTNCNVGLCKSCHQRATTSICPKTLGSHNFKVMRGPPSAPTFARHGQCSRPASFVRPEPRGDVNSGSCVHAGVTCDACNKTIHGIRHKCLDCSNYDLCTRCITTGHAERHNPFHEFYEIREPGRVVVHTVFGGQQLPTGNAGPAAPVHTATCDLCDSRITGDRYKCTMCPDFDTCLSCFAITDVQHPNHSFVKITKPEDLIYRDVIQRAIHSATCDGCNRTIYGTRFKCMHPNCPDYDLCQNCESLPIPVHPKNHPMLKMKTPDTVVPTIYRVGQPNLVRPFNSTTPTPGPRTDENIRGTSPAQTPVGVTRAATPTPASVGLETGMPPKEGSPANIQDKSTFSAAKPTSMNPFADMFSVDSNLLPTWAGMTDPWPIVIDMEGERIRQELSGSIASPRAEAKEDNRVECSEGKIVLGPESPLASDSNMPKLAVNEPDTVKADSNAKSVDGLGTEISLLRESLASLMRELVPPPISPSTEVKNSGPRMELSAAFVDDVTVPDGQVFPPGAEFVKCWRLINDSGCDWPESTELVFIAGDPLSTASTDNGATISVGKISPGELTDVWTWELKAPEVAGRYVGYWRLRANGELFGNSLWVDINVVEADRHNSSEESMASSAVIMPAASSAPQSQHVPSVTVTLSTQGGSVASAGDDNLSEAGSDMSLISMPSSPSEDEVWHSPKSRASSKPSGAPTVAPGTSAASRSEVDCIDYDNESDEEYVF